MIRPVAYSVVYLKSKFDILSVFLVYTKQQRRGGAAQQQQMGGLMGANAQFASSGPMPTNNSGMVTQQAMDPAIMSRLQELPKIVAGVMTNDEQSQLESTTQFRKLLSIERNPPIQAVIDTGVVPRFVHFLGYEHNPPLQVRHFIWMLEETISICCYFCIHMPHFLFPLYSLKRRGH